MSYIESLSVLRTQLRKFQKHLRHDDVSDVERIVRELESILDEADDCYESADALHDTLYDALLAMPVKLRESRNGELLDDAVTDIDDAKQRIGEIGDLLSEFDLAPQWGGVNERDEILSEVDNNFDKAFESLDRVADGLNELSP